jgi:cytochrome P450
MAAFAPRVGRIAEELLHEASGQPVVDLMANFTTRYPLTVLCELLGIPLERVDQAVAACRGMHSSDPAEVGKAMGTFAALSHAALENDQAPGRRARPHRRHLGGVRARRPAPAPARTVHPLAIHDRRDVPRRDRRPGGLSGARRHEGINASAERDLTFGAGPHYCTGAHLAQMELEVLVDVVRSAFPSLGWTSRSPLCDRSAAAGSVVAG